jgi:hypothetical protein
MTTLTPPPTTPTSTPAARRTAVQPVPSGGADTPPADDRAGSSRTGDVRARLAGAGALGFVGLVVVQNALRGSAAPQPGATTEEVTTYFVDHRGLTTLLVGTFVLGMVSLGLFVGGTARRLVASARSGWATTGLVGVGAIVTLFAGVVGTEQALAVVAAGPDPDAGAVQALWALHNSLFSANFAFIGLALLGLARAGVAAGITPKVVGRLAPVGAALLGISTVSGPFIANGEAMPFFALGGLGFLVWLAFLTTTGLRLVRGAK